VEASGGGADVVTQVSFRAMHPTPCRELKICTYCYSQSSSQFVNCMDMDNSAKYRR
jgi:hypothetical protein